MYRRTRHAPPLPADELLDDPLTSGFRGGFSALLRQAVDGSLPPAAQGAADLRLLSPGTMIEDRYRIQHVLGAGAMGVVYSARDTRMGGKAVALKLLRSEVGGSGATARLVREGTVAGPIDHPNVVRILHAGLFRARPYLVLELLVGEPLSARIRRGPMDILQAVRITRAMLRGVGAVHQHGIIHRDLKPANVFLAMSEDGRREVPKVLDFGIAKPDPLLFGAMTVTDPRVRLGTPHYMPSEQIRGDPIDARADLYSASIMLYVMLVGRLPFSAPTEFELYRRILEGDFVRPRLLRADIPPRLERVLLIGMACHRRDRFSDAQAMSEALELAMDASAPSGSLEPGRSRWARAMLAGGAALVVCIALACVSWTLRIATNGGERAAPPPLPTPAPARTE